MRTLKQIGVLLLPLVVGSVVLGFVIACIVLMANGVIWPFSILGFLALAYAIGIWILDP